MTRARVSVPWEAVVDNRGALARYRELADANRERPLVERAADEARRLALVKFDRSGLVKHLTSSLAALDAPPPVLESVRALGDARTTLVITGQQPGFLGGPLFTLFKAAHAVVLARAVQAATGAVCVPVFWNHSDDHDLDETRGVSLVDSRGELHRIALDIGRGRPFLSDVVVPESAAEVNGRVKDLLPAGPDRDRILTLSAPRPGERFAAATSRFLLGLLGNRGLVVFEPNDIRDLLSKHLAAVVRNVKIGLERLARTNESLRSSHLTPAFDERDPAILFERTAAGRERVNFQNGEFALPSGTTLTPSALAELIEHEPARFSAGVASRCVVEALALPVVATIRGPGELIYTPSAYGFLPPDSPRTAPIEFPRFSATLVEPRIAGILTQAGLTASSVVQSKEHALDELPSVPLDASEKELESLEVAIRQKLEGLAEPLRSLDTNLQRPLEKTLSTATSAVSSLRARVRRAVEEKSATGAARVRRALNNLRPSGQPQERLLPAAPFLCQELDARVAAILENIPPYPDAHAILELGPPPA